VGLFYFVCVGCVGCVVCLFSSSSVACGGLLSAVCGFSVVYGVA